MVALLIVFAFILLEKFSRRKTKRWSENPSSQLSQGWKLKNYRAFFAILISLFPPFFSIGTTSFWVLINIDQIKQGFNEELFTLSLRTVCLGLITALITIIFSLIIALANRQSKNFILQLITYPASAGYNMGTVLALSLITISSSN